MKLDIPSHSDPNYEYWNRPQKHFEDIEISFFEESDISMPERIIQLLAVKPQDAMDTGNQLDTVFLQKGGCYLIFDSYEHLAKKRVFPLYVGKANNIERRLREHWGSRDNFIDQHLESICDENRALMQPEEIDTDVPDYKKLPVGFIRFAYWFQSDSRERMLLEHELIYKCRPHYNRA